MFIKSFILFVVPVLFYSSNAETTVAKSGGIKTTTAKLSQQQMSRILPESPATSPTTVPDNFRDSLRFKMKLVNDAMLYGGSNYATATATTASPGIPELDEALSISSAELGASKEVNVEDTMRSILDADHITSRPLEPVHRRFSSRITTGVKNRHGAAFTGDQRRFKAAVRTKHTFEYRPVKIEQFREQPEPKIIEVEARSLPLEIHFKSASSRIKMVQEHQKGELQQEERTQSQEEPQRLFHVVRKPIIQEVREIITPYRRILQEIQPVIEEIHTVISHGGQQHRHEDEQQLIGTDATVIGRPTSVETEEESSEIDKFQRQTLKPSTSTTTSVTTVATTRPKIESSANLMKNLESFVRAQQQSSTTSSAGSSHRSTSATPRRLVQQTPISYDSSSYDTSEFERSQVSSHGISDSDIQQIAPARQIFQQQQIQRPQQIDFWSNFFLLYNLRKNVFATNPFHYSYGGKMMNLIQPLQQQQHQQQKLEQETENPVQFDDCLGVQQPRKSQSRSDLNIVAQQQPSMPFSTSTPTPSEQQLEQFIQSLKPQNMDADIEDDNADSGKDDNINKTNDLMNTGDDENQPRKHSDFEIDLIDSSIKPQQQQNRNFENERFEQQNLMIDSISAKNGQQMSNNQQKNNRRGQPQRFKAAVLTRYSMEYRPIDSNLLAEHHHHEIEGDDLNAGDERIIEVLPQSRPLQIHFKSPSNRIKVVQSSINDNGKQEENIHQEPEIERTEEEPRLYYQQIRKPILQQVHEIIMPYRKVIQEVKPVVEQVHTVVTSSRSPQPFTVQSKFRKSNSINQSTTTATATELNKFNRSPISRFKQIQQQQKQQHPNQKEQFQSSTINEDSPTVTLSPLLIGVEQMVEPNVGGDN
ncbi:hypothetical protein DERF_014154, partial [Dermatophagoides farinae]